ATYNQVVFDVTIGNQIRALALNESNNRLYVISVTFGSATSFSSSQITAIDVNPANLTTFHRVVGSGAVSVSNTNVNDAVVNPATDKVYVGDTNSLRVVNGTTLASSQIANVPSAF